MDEEGLGGLFKWMDGLGRGGKGRGKGFGLVWFEWMDYMFVLYLEKYCLLDFDLNG